MEIKRIGNSVVIMIIGLGLSALLSSCAAVKNIQDSEVAQTIGGFELNPVQPNNYWYNGKSYEYNQYEIEITAKPCSARIKWNGKPIGSTPLIYKYTGTLDRDDRLTVQAIPYDENMAPQNGELRIRSELPRKINFDLLPKK